MPETEFIEVLSEEEEHAALAGDHGNLDAPAAVPFAPPPPAVPYLPTAADLDAQAAADREQAQADADYRELAPPVVSVAPCRCGGADCFACRCRKWLASGL
jgi:hypothetical protein